MFTDICPKSNRPWVPPGETSQVGDFDDPIPPLFEILTLKPDVHERWTVFSYNVESEINTSDNHENSRRKFLLFPFLFNLFKATFFQRNLNSISDSKRSYDNQEATKFKLGSANLLSKDLKTSLNSKKATNENNNCTVAFMVECMSLEKCKRMCESIGSSYWRWFHDGCCECAGQNCISYGLKKSTCLRCPFVPPAPKPQQEGPEEEEEYIDYGQWQDEEYECDPTVSVCPRLND